MTPRRSRPGRPWTQGWRLTSVLPRVIPWWGQLGQAQGRATAHHPGASDADTTGQVIAPAAARLSPGARARVLAPLRPAPGASALRWGEEPARQHDGTTCGSAVLAMVAAAGDRRLALWLETGERVGGRAGPPELAGVGPAELDRLDGSGARFVALQHRLKAASCHRAAAGMPWPSAWGTPPWGAARVARFGAWRFRHVVVGGRHQARVLDAVASWAQAGIPVPLYTGGDLGRGLATAVPRHVVLVTDVVGPVWHVYEPSRGIVHEVTRDQLTAGAPLAALGGWNHVTWALLPRPGADRHGR